MDLGPVTTLDKRNKTKSKNLTMSCWKIVMSFLIFLIYSQFGAIQKLHSGCIVCKTYIFIKSDLLSYTIFLSKVTFYLTKTENRTKKSLTQLSHYCFEERYYFSLKRLIFCKKWWISTINRALELKGIFSETKFMCTYVPNFKFLA